MYNPQKPYKHDLLDLIRATWKTKYVTVTDGVYPIIKKKFSYPEVQHADGIGTKGYYHSRAKSYKNAVIDALAMNLNDLALVGAVPYALVDHIVTPDMGHESVMAVIRALALECRKRNIALVGGETSHHNNVDGIDIGLVVSGFIKKVRKNELKPGSVLVGLKSNGLHANGITRVRAMYGTDEWRDEFVAPTAIYLDQVHEILKTCDVQGMMHITGGAFTKLKDLLKNADASIHHPPAMRPQNIFMELYDRGVPSEDMYTTFNCGIGFVLGMSERDALKVVKRYRNAAIVGRTTKGTERVHIVSAFDGTSITL